MTLASNIRVRRGRLELSQKELAKRAGISQQLVHALENGTIHSTKFIKQISMALGCAVTDLDKKQGRGGEIQSRSADLEDRHGDLPIFAAAETDMGTVLISDAPIDFITRPFPLFNVRGGYGIMVAANFMSPEFELGDYVLVNPHIPPIPDTTCVFYKESGESTVGCIRRLTFNNHDEWRVKLWNPPTPDEETAVLKRDIWQKCHRIVGRYFRR